MQLGCIRRDAFHSFSLGAVHLHSEEQTGAHELAVQRNSASATNTVLAANVGPGESEIVAEKIGEKLARFHFPGVFMPVDGQPYLPCAHWVFLFVCSAAR